ncbi:MAG: hypothetical protein WD005_03950 [Haliea sp.]
MPGAYWDLIITMDDANGSVYFGFFVDEEGTVSSFRGMSETITRQGLFSSFYSDRGSHYWHTPEAGGKWIKPASPSLAAPCSSWASS